MDTDARLVMSYNLSNGKVMIVLREPTAYLFYLCNRNYQQVAKIRKCGWVKCFISVLIDDEARFRVSEDSKGYVVRLLK